MEIGVVKPYAAQSSQGSQLPFLKGIEDIRAPMPRPARELEIWSVLLDAMPLTFKRLVKYKYGIERGKLAASYTEIETDNDRMDYDAELENEESGDLLLEGEHSACLIGISLGDEGFIELLFIALSWPSRNPNP